MDKKEAMDYIKLVFDDTQIAIAPIEDYIFKDYPNLGDFFAHEERSGGPFYGEIHQGKFYLFGTKYGFNIDTLDEQNFEPKVEGAMYHVILSKMDDIITTLEKGTKP